MLVNVPLDVFSVSGVVEYVVPSVDSSTPVGAVTVTVVAKSLPLTAKGCAVPAVPEVVVPRFTELLPTVSVGVAAAFTVPLTETSGSVASVLMTVIVPLIALGEARALIRA